MATVVTEPDIERYLNKNSVKYCISVMSDVVYKITG
jgi:hypothetical protein